MGDPLWAIEAGLTEAQVWERRAVKQLTRSQEAEEKIVALEERVSHLEQRVAEAGGVTREAAVIAFCAMQWPGEEVTDIKSRVEAVVSEDTEMGRPVFKWAMRCYVDGTSMKIGGRRLPGDVFVVTWWL
jgi:hypothetical protein